MEKNLWGNLDGLVGDLSVPEDILNKQAEYLKESFGGLVSCKVLRINLSKEWKLFYDGLHIASDFTFSFRICSDYVEKFEYEICSMTYGITMYPLALSFEEGIAEEVKEQLKLKDGDTVVVDNEEMLLNVLQKILSSKEVHQVLKGLLTIAKKEKESVYCPFD